LAVFSEASVQKRVSLTIPFAVIGFFLAAQLALGTSLALIGLCAFAVAVPLLPLWLYGRDLYSAMGINFSLRYVGIALAAKTFYGQTLESHLFHPYAAYALTGLLMAVVTAVLVLVRKFDRGTELFPLPTDPASLRRLSLICIVVGMAALVVVAANRSMETGAFNGGAVLVLASNVSNLFILGIVAEALYGVVRFNGQGFITLRLVVLFVLAVAVATALNARIVVVTSLISVIVATFLTGSLRLKHVIFGLAAGSFFLYVFSPVTLYLRLSREGMTRTQFIQFAGQTVARLASDPQFFTLISNTVKASEVQDETRQPPYDYFGDRANVPNRLSFVALVDAVYTATMSREPIGMAAVNHSLTTLTPGFLRTDKEITTYGMGDWLSWETGLSEPGFIAFLNFGLPMEGLAAWGLTGFILYPFIIYFIAFYTCSKVSTFRFALPASIVIAVIMGHPAIEGTSDEILAWVTRTIPIYLALLYGLHKILTAGMPASRSPAPRVSF
jgi:hypothetical protein